MSCFLKSNYSFRYHKVLSSQWTVLQVNYYLYSNYQNSSTIIPQVPHMLTTLDPFLHNQFIHFMRVGLLFLFLFNGQKEERADLGRIINWDKKDLEVRVCKPTVFLWIFCSTMNLRTGIPHFTASLTNFGFHFGAWSPGMLLSLAWSY